MKSNDFVDARNVVAAQGNLLDWSYIEHWCDAHGSRPLLEKIRAELKER